MAEVLLFLNDKDSVLGPGLVLEDVLINHAI